MAFEKGRPYISACHAGIVSCCVPIIENETLLGGVFFGKCLPEPLSEDTEKNIVTRLKGLPLKSSKIKAAVGCLRVIDEGDLYKAANAVFTLLGEITHLDQQIKWDPEKEKQRSKNCASSQENKKTSPNHRYPYSCERVLIEKIKVGDKSAAKVILDSIIGSIILDNPGELNVLKVRMVELLSLLSRAVVEEGANIDVILEKNLNCIQTIVNLDTQEEIFECLTESIDDFIDCAYKSDPGKKVTQLRPALDYIEANYDRQVRLSDIAAAAYLSVSRLSHLFKERLSISVINYLTSVRISHAKYMLLTTDDSCIAIGLKVGYNNPSYFARTFKDFVGMAPNQFRKKSLEKYDFDQGIFPFQSNTSFTEITKDHINAD